MGKREKKRQRERKKQNIQRQQQRVKKLKPAGKRLSVSYKKTESTLVVGDGDFSFSLGLANHRASGHNLIATSYDPEHDIHKKYPLAKANIEKIVGFGAVVLHGINATKLSSTFTRQFDRIIFNFPHTGKQRVHENRHLLYQFFFSAVDQLLPGGQVHITLKMQPPYSNWQVEENANKAGLIVDTLYTFDPSSFGGYRHKTTDPNAKKFDFREHAKTFAFRDGRPGGAAPLPPAEALVRSGGSGYHPLCLEQMLQQHFSGGVPDLSASRKKSGSAAPVAAGAGVAAPASAGTPKRKQRKTNS